MTLGRRDRRRALREQGLNPRVLSATVAQEYLRPYLGDVHEHVDRWCKATARPPAETVMFFGPRAELARFFPSALLPETDKPITMTVNCEGLQAVFVDAGYPGFAKIHAGLAMPATHGELRVLVLNSVGVTLVRVYPEGAAAPAPGGVA